MPPVFSRKQCSQNWVMDKIRPKITVSEMQMARPDCSAKYEIIVQLLKKDENFDRYALLPRFQRQEKRWEPWAGERHLPYSTNDNF